MALERHQHSQSCKFPQTIRARTDLAILTLKLRAIFDSCSHLTANKLTGELPDDLFDLADTMEYLYSEYDDPN